MSWSVVKYVEALSGMGKRCSGTQKYVEVELNRMFPPGEMTNVSEPCLVVDCHGIILLWFLPGLLNWKRKVGGSLSIVNFTNIIIRCLCGNP